MPTTREILIYLNGLWLLFQRDPKGFQYMDMTDRGMMRSFWAIVWAAPAIALSWIWWRMNYMDGMTAATAQPALLFFFRLGLLEAANWLMPLVLVGVLCLLLDISDKFPAIVAATNWLALPVSYAYGVLIILMMIAPGLPALIALAWFVLMVVLVAALFRILWTICGDHLLMVSTLTMVLLVPSMIISETLERYLDVFPR